MSEPYVTLRWPRDLSLSPGFPVPWRAWTRLEDGRLEVRYRDREELEACLWTLRALIHDEPVEQE